MFLLYPCKRNTRGAISKKEEEKKESEKMKERSAVV